MRSGLKQKIVGARSIQDAEEAAKSESSVFMRTDGDSVDTHMLNGVVVTTWLSHIAEVENVGFIYFQIFHQLIHAKFFVHTGDKSIDGGSAGDLVFKVGGELLSALDDTLALAMVGVPSVFLFGAGVLTEPGKGDLREAVLDNFVIFVLGPKV